MFVLICYYTPRSFIRHKTSL